MGGICVFSFFIFGQSIRVRIAPSKQALAPRPPKNSIYRKSLEPPQSLYQTTNSKSFISKPTSQRSLSIYSLFINQIHPSIQIKLANMQFSSILAAVVFMTLSVSAVPLLIEEGAAISARDCGPCTGPSWDVAVSYQSDFQQIRFCLYFQLTIVFPKS